MKKATLKSETQISFPKERIAEFCRKHHIKKLAIFGSALRSDFRDDSDIDVLVEFEPDHIPGTGILYHSGRVIGYSGQKSRFEYCSMFEQVF